MAPHVEKRSEKTGKLVLGQCSGSFFLLVIALQWGHCDCVFNLLVYVIR